MDNLLTRVTIGGTTSSVRHIYDEQWNVLCDIDASSGAILDEVRPRTAVRGHLLAAQFPVGFPYDHQLNQFHVVSICLQTHYPLSDPFS